MQKGPFLCPDKRMSLDNEERADISLEELSFTPKQSLRHPLEGSPPNINDTKRYSVRKNCKGYLDILFGIMPLNYFPEPPRHYLGGSFRLLKVRSPRCRSL